MNLGRYDVIILVLCLFCADQARIFEEFVQLDSYYDGTGIGLTVARSVARRLGGDITLDCSYTQGARFLFSLPH